MENSFLNKPNYIRIYGHRGARGDIVENSIEGFKYTFDLSVSYIFKPFRLDKNKKYVPRGLGSNVGSNQWSSVNQLHQKKKYNRFDVTTL